MLCRAGRRPGSFDHLTVGTGNPVALHFGRVMLEFLATYVGPNLSVILGRAKQ